MIAKLTERRAFWKAHHIVECQGDSIALPFEAIDDHQTLFAKRRLLEIGPGEGRQFTALRAIAGSYAVADIVPEVLALPVYADASARYLIDRFDDLDLHDRFDVITFWYVLHHVCIDEADAFFDFLSRHLDPGGRLIFNAPHANPAAEYADGTGDGCATTVWTPAQIVDALTQRGFTIEQQLDLAPNCLVFVAALR